jgi:hypothetical protein
MSTRAPPPAASRVWRVRAAARERDRLMHMLDSGRTMLAPEARRELWMEFSLADQEYRFAVAALAGFCQTHGMQEQVAEPLQAP